MPGAKRFVYGIASDIDGPRPYIGLTWDVHERLHAHNAGASPHTARYRPWRLVVAFELPTEREAIALEQYLKSGSGRAFVSRHFLSGSFARGHGAPTT